MKLKEKKQLIEKAYEFGRKGFGKYNSAPHFNPEFISIVPNCLFGDEKIVKLRIKMYKEYIKGWTEEHVKTID